MTRRRNNPKNYAWTDDGKEPVYRIVEGRDHFTDKPLYRVVGTNNDYAGLWTYYKQAKAEKDDLEEKAYKGAKANPKGPDPRGRGWTQKGSQWLWDDQTAGMSFMVSEKQGPGMPIYTLQALTAHGMYKHTKPSQWKTANKAFAAAAKWFPALTGATVGSDLTQHWLKMNRNPKLKKYDFVNIEGGVLAGSLGYLVDDLGDFAADVMIVKPSSGALSYGISKGMTAQVKPIWLSPAAHGEWSNPKRSNPKGTYTDAELLAYLKGTKHGIRVADLVFMAGGTPSRHTARLQKLVKSGKLTAKGGYGKGGKTTRYFLASQVSPLKRLTYPERNPVKPRWFDIKSGVKRHGMGEAVTTGGAFTMGGDTYAEFRIPPRRDDPHSSSYLEHVMVSPAWAKKHTVYVAQTKNPNRKRNPVKPSIDLHAEWSEVVEAGRKRGQQEYAKLTRKLAKVFAGGGWKLHMDGMMTSHIGHYYSGSDGMRMAGMLYFEDRRYARNQEETEDWLDRYIGLTYGLTLKGYSEKGAKQWMLPLEES